MTLVEQVRADLATAPVPDKLRALLRIAAADLPSAHRIAEHGYLNNID